MIRGLAILFGFQVGGDAVASLLNLPIPGSVVGMALLLGALLVGWLKLSLVEATAAVLLGNLGVFFVPSAVSIMLFGEIVRRQWVPIAVALVGSSIMVLLVTGLVQQALERPVTEERPDESTSVVVDSRTPLWRDPHARRI